MTKLFRAIPFIAILIVWAFCADTRKLTYFNDGPDSEIATNVENLEPVIQENHLLSISVSSLSPDASQIFNTPDISGSVAGNQSSTGCPVDKDGYTQLFVLGNIKATGFTKTALRDTIIYINKVSIDPAANRCL